MGNTLNSPITDTESSSFRFEDHNGTVVTMQGWRLSMEVVSDKNSKWIGFFHC